MLAHLIDIKAAGVIFLCWCFWQVRMHKDCCIQVMKRLFRPWWLKIEICLHWFDVQSGNQSWIENEDPAGQCNSIRCSDLWYHGTKCATLNESAMAVILILHVNYLASHEKEWTSCLHNTLWMSKWHVTWVWSLNLSIRWATPCNLSKIWHWQNL